MWVMSNPVAELIAAFGGTTAASRAIGAPITTVDTWKSTGRIPHWRMEAVRKAAEDAKIDLPAALQEQAA